MTDRPAPSARERIAEVVASYLAHETTQGPVSRECADALLAPAGPVTVIVAQALRDAAHFLDDGDAQAAAVSSGGAAHVHRVICDRADTIEREGL